MAHHSQKITDPDGIIILVELTGETVTLSDPKGQEFHFSVQLIPELVGTLHDIDKVFCREVR